MAVTMVQPLPSPPRNSDDNRQRGFIIASVSKQVKSRPSTRPVRAIAARFLTCVTMCTSATFLSAKATDHPTRGTLTHSGFAASAITSTRLREVILGFRHGRLRGAFKSSSYSVGVTARQTFLRAAVESARTSLRTHVRQASVVRGGDHAEGSLRQMPEQAQQLLDALPLSREVPFERATAAPT